MTKIPKVGDTVLYNGRPYKALGYAAKCDANGTPYIEIAWNDYSLSLSGYMAVPICELVID